MDGHSWPKLDSVMLCDELLSRLLIVRKIWRVSHVRAISFCSYFCSIGFVGREVYGPRKEEVRGYRGWRLGGRRQCQILSHADNLRTAGSESFRWMVYSARHTCCPLINTTSHPHSSLSFITGHRHYASIWMQWKN